MAISMDLNCRTSVEIILFTGEEHYECLADSGVGDKGFCCQCLSDRKERAQLAGCLCPSRGIGGICPFHLIAHSAFERIFVIVECDEQLQDGCVFLKRPVMLL